MLKTTAHQTAMLARPRFTCPGAVARANRRAARDVTRLYRRMSAAHVTQQSRWACETSIAERLPSTSRSLAPSIGRRRRGRRRHRRHRRRRRRRPRRHGAYRRSLVGTHALRVSADRSSASRLPRRERDTPRRAALYGTFFPSCTSRELGRCTGTQARTRNARKRLRGAHPTPGSPGQTLALRSRRRRRHPPPPFVTFLLCHMDRRRASASASAVAASTRLPDGATLYCLLSPVRARHAPTRYEVVRL